jgi:hypothetical protein
VRKSKKTFTICTVGWVPQARNVFDLELCVENTPIDTQPIFLSLIRFPLSVWKMFSRLEFYYVYVLQMRAWNCLLSCRHAIVPFDLSEPVALSAATRLIKRAQNLTSSRGQSLSFQPCHLTEGRGLGRADVTRTNARREHHCQNVSKLSEFGAMRSRGRKSHSPRGQLDLLIFLLSKQ